MEAQLVNDLVSTLLELDRIANQVGMVAQLLDLLDAEMGNSLVGIDLVSMPQHSELIQQLLYQLLHGHCDSCFRDSHIATWMF